MAWLGRDPLGPPPIQPSRLDSVDLAIQARPPARNRQSSLGWINGLKIRLATRACCWRELARVGCRGFVLLLAAALVAWWLSMPTGALAAGGGSPGVAAGPRSELVPVWAYVNGDLPLAGAWVGIVTQKGAMRQVNGRLLARTNAHGVVVLAFAHVPRRFSVIVTGGRAGGQALKGSLRTEVHTYSGAAGVVEVNPLTTVLARLRSERPRLTYGAAALLVKRYYRVPAWADLAENLRTSRAWFDARAYLRQARRYGSVDGLTRIVVWRMLHGQRRMARVALPVRVVSADAMATTAGFAPAITSVGLAHNATKLVVRVFKSLLGTTVKIKREELVGGALGGLLQLAKVLGLAPDTPTELAGVREQLDALSTQLTRVEGQVKDVSKRLERIHASQLLAQSNGVIARISDAYKRLALLANMTPTDTTRESFAAILTAQIAKLTEAPEELDLQLRPKLEIGDNVFKAASRSLATSNLFFDERQSQTVEAVYEYFATYQAQLAILLTNYYNANPKAYSPETIRALISPIETNVTAQAQSLKPPVPPRTFIDTRTPKFMWGVLPGRVSALTLLQDHIQTSRMLNMGAFNNYQLPSSHDLRNLLAGATPGDDARAWLQPQIAVHLSDPLVWVSDPFVRTTSPHNCQIFIQIFNLRTAKYENYSGGRYVQTSPTCNLQDPATRRFLASMHGGVLFLRYLAPGESYWW